MAVVSGPGGVTPGGGGGPLTGSPNPPAGGSMAPCVSNAMAAGAPRVIYPVITPRPPHEGTPEPLPVSVQAYVAPVPPRNSATTYYGAV